MVFGDRCGIHGVVPLTSTSDDATDRSIEDRVPLDGRTMVQPPHFKLSSARVVSV